MKLGILYPRSQEHPGITADFIDGIKAALEEHQVAQQVHLIAESVGFGGVEKEVFEKAEKLLILEAVDILVAFIDLRILESLESLVSASGKLVLVVNTGANIPSSWKPLPNVIHLSLMHAFLCWLTGRQAAKLPGNNGAMVTSFYDCGYKHASLMVTGFVNGGGEITYNYVNNQRYFSDNFNIEPLSGYLSADNKTQTLLCILDTLPASLFYNELDNYKEAGGLELFVSPMMLEKKALEKPAGNIKFAINGYLSWDASRDDNTNTGFIKSFERQAKRTPGMFALLGWECGLVINEIILQNKEDYSDGKALVADLARIGINSPRGKMNLDTDTGYFRGPVSRCSRDKISGSISVEFIEKTAADWADFTKIPNDGLSSGWTNTYPCY